MFGYSSVSGLQSFPPLATRLRGFRKGLPDRKEKNNNSLASISLGSTQPKIKKILSLIEFRLNCKQRLVYAPTNEAEVEAKDDFYDQLQKVIDSVPKLDILVLMGDWNAKVGERQVGEEGVMGKEALKCVRNDNGERFVGFCVTNSLVITTTSFPHKDIHKYITWTSPDGRTRNQIDHVAVDSRFKRSLFHTRSYRGADVLSDHNLVVAVMQLKLCRVGKKASNTSKYECSKLRIPEVRQEFLIRLNRFSCMEGNDHHTTADLDEGEEHTQPDLEQKWESFKSVFNESAKTVLGYKMKKSKSWITADSWKKIENRRAMKRMVDGAKSSRQKALKKEEYQRLDKEVNSSLRKDKREWANNIAQEAEDAARQGQMKGVHEATRKLCNERPKRVDMVKDREGKLLSKEDEVRKRWQEHFMEVLNRPDPETVAEVVDDSDNNKEIEQGPVTKLEIKNAIKDMKNGKAAGIDKITVEMMKADIDTAVYVLHDLLSLIWEEERISEDWCKGLIVKLPKKGDLTNCGNWRGITLMPTAAKVMGKVIIKRISRGVDKKLRKEQAGFRSGRSTIEQIFVLRNIIEQSVKWNASLYICFIDYEKAFDSVHRETLWMIMSSYGIPPKLVRMIQAMYKGSKCAVIDGGGKTGWFDIKSGVRQGCVISGFVFLLVIDWVMRKTLSEGNTGIR